MLDLLVRAGEFAGTAGASALLAGRGFLTNDVGVQIARALLGKVVRLGALRALVDDHVDHLRDHVASPLNYNGIADANVAAFTQRFAVAADALDVVLIVQGDVLHDDTAHAHRLEFPDGSQRARAADLNFDVLKDRHGALGRKFVRDRPARRA